MEAFLALGAIAGGLVLALYPNGGGPMDFDVEHLEGSPFANYLIPGLFLAGLGVAAAMAAVMHWHRAVLAPYVSFLTGVLLVAFELIEVTLIPFSPLQPFYFAVGIAIAWVATRSARDDAQALTMLRDYVRFLGYRAAAVVLIALLALYALAIRPWFIDWGSTEAEKQAVLTGDELKP